MITQDDLHSTLLPYGINTKAIDRYVVTQQRQALAVADPVALVQHFELLLVGGIGPVHTRHTHLCVPCVCQHACSCWTL
jgi:hypothetical protein